MGKYLLFDVILIVFLLLPVWEVNGHDSIPVSLISVDKDIYSICVDKSNQKVHLFNGREKVFEIPCSTGMNPGDKQIEGDKCTPEGVYFFENILQGDNLPDFYGWRAYTLNYPNPIDMSDGKNGDGIWIHGRIIPLGPTDTKGCVSLDNDNLKKLSRYLCAYRTPIISLDDIIYIDEISLDAMEEVYTKFIYRWIYAWEDKDIEEYRACYSKDFFDTLRGDVLETYIDRKKKTFEKYEYISIRTNGMRIVGSDEYILCYFLMDFSGGGFQSTGVKYVYLDNSSDGPKILAEEFIPLHKVTMWNQEAEDLINRENQACKDFLDSWITSWESKKMESMKAFYLDTFPMKDEFFARKQINIKPYQFIKVTLDDIETKRNGVYWKLRAKQEFTSDCYRDVGIKELTLIRTRKGFFISEENWERLYEES